MAKGNSDGQSVCAGVNLGDAAEALMPKRIESQGLYLG